MLYPTKDRIVAAPIKSETKSPGGIIIPEAAQKNTQKAVIVQIGPGSTETAKFSLRAGDTVLYSSALRVYEQERELLIIEAKDVLAVVR